MIFDTIYSFIPMIALMVVGLILWLPKPRKWTWLRQSTNKWTWYIFGVMVLYYVAYMTLQEVTGTNSPSFQSIFLNAVSGITVTIIAVKTKTGWPLIVSVLLLSCSMMDYVHYSHTYKYGIPEWNRGYQDAGAIIYLIILLVVVLCGALRLKKARHGLYWGFA